jgi:hypothetical protein
MLLRVLPLALAAGLLACNLGAQTPAPTNRPPPSTDTAPDAQKKKRAISEDLAATLNAGLPKYEPQKPQPKPTPEEEFVDLREVDKPKNEIIRLPRYIVEGSRPPIFRERDIHTQRGLGALAAQRYLSGLDRNFLNRFTLPFIGLTPEQRALIMYAEDERLRNMSEFRDHAANAAAAGDAAGSAYIKRTSTETFMHRSDFGWSNQK